MAVTVGNKAPDFTLFDTEKKDRSLKEFLGKKTVLAFYPGAFTGVCTKELCTLRDSMTRFNELNAQVIGVSVDSPFANKAFAAQNNLQFPLLSDFTRATIRDYGIVHENFSGLTGYAASKRSVFVLDKDGVVRYAWVSDIPGVEPNYEEVTKALASIS
ncbi:MAG: peroxiredoxin [Ignavibacteriales bacterium]|nr:peroxiredoxin [Ignavibacteriales bacterium]